MDGVLHLPKTEPLSRVVATQKRAMQPTYPTELGPAKDGVVVPFAPAFLFLGFDARFGLDRGLRDTKAPLLPATCICQCSAGQYALRQLAGSTPTICFECPGSS
jgi:hypothetical protein